MAQLHQTSSAPLGTTREAWSVPSTTIVAGPFALDWGLVVIGGFVATLIITPMLYYIPPLMGMDPMDVGTMLGTMLLPYNQAAAFWVGTVWHFINGIVFTLVYALVLLGLRKQSSWATGAWFGAILWLVGPMLIMPVMLTWHPLVPAEMPNPGFFMLGMGMGWTPALFDLGVHLVYGMVAGAIYKHCVCRPL